MLTILAALAASPAPDPIHTFLRDYLRDYDSAKIEIAEDIAQPRPILWKIRCGLLQRGCRSEEFRAKVHCYRINAKNAYGAYTGWEIHWLAERDGAIFDGGSHRVDVQRYCGVYPWGQG